MVVGCYGRVGKIGGGLNRCGLVGMGFDLSAVGYFVAFDANCWAVPVELNCKVELAIDLAVDFGPNFVPDAVLNSDLFRVAGFEVDVEVALGESDFDLDPDCAPDLYGTELVRDFALNLVVENFLAFADYKLLGLVLLVVALDLPVVAPASALDHSDYSDALICNSVFSTQEPPYQVGAVSGEVGQ